MEIICVTGIMACDPEGLIGAGNHMPWHYPAEQQHFYDIIQDKPLIMGYNTYLSAPLHLRHRTGNIVFSHAHKLAHKPPGVRFISSTESFSRKFIIESPLAGDTGQKIPPLLSASNPRAISMITAQSTHFMIGGAQITRLFCEKHWLDTFILSHIKQRYQGDVWLDLCCFEGWQSFVTEESEDYAVKLYYRL